MAVRKCDRLVVSVCGTAAKADSFRKMKAVSRARVLIGSIDVEAGHDTVAGQGGDGPGSGVLGHADGGADVSDADRGDPALAVWLGSVGEFFEDDPGEGPEPAPPCSAFGVEDYLDGRAGHLIALAGGVRGLHLSREAEGRSSQESRSVLAKVRG